jgi:tetratricopeptide (TPR) repeat protein
MVQEGKGWMPREAHEEGLRVARLLAKKIEAEGVSVRKVEELVGWGQKTLQQVLNGEQPIRISHLAAVLAALGLDLREFYRELEKSAGSARSSPLAPEGRAERTAFWGHLGPLTAEERRYFLETCREFQNLLSEAAATGSGASSADEHGLPKGPPAFEALLARSFALRYDDPTAMVGLARFAAFLADHFDRRRYEAKRVADWRCRAYTELGNAYRVAERLQECEEALKIAAVQYALGTADELLGARLLEIQASFDADRRHLPEALNALDEVHALHLRRGDCHLAGRALVKKGVYASYAGDSELAILLLGQGLEMIDHDRDPELVNQTFRNLALSLVECGRLAEAKEQLRHHRASGRVERLNVLWLEGQLEAGFGNLEPAEEALERVRHGFEDMHLHYKAALASLELAAVHLRQGRTDDARERAQQAIEVFSQLGIGRETLAALLVLRDAFERRVATVGLLEGVIRRLSHLEREPAGLGLREFHRELAKSAESVRVSPPATEDHGDTAAVWGSLGALTAEERRYFLEASRKFQAVVSAVRWSTGAYGYDGAGNVKAIGTHTFIYDKVSRLKTGNLYLEPNGSTTLRTQTYTFDAFGNILAVGGNGAHNTPTTSATNHLSSGNYDASGNLVNHSGSTIQYDPFNLMWSYRTLSDEWIHLYTADDERVWSYKTDNTSLWSLRSPGGTVLREYANNGTWSVTSDYIHRDSSLLAAETPQGIRHFHLDHLGSPRLISDSLGQQKAYHVYYPFGEEATAFNQDTIRTKFTGHERDLGNLGGVGDDLDYMHARHCSPVTGRFLSIDIARGKVKTFQTQRSTEDFSPDY